MSSSLSNNATGQDGGHETLINKRMARNSGANQRGERFLLGLVSMGLEGIDLVFHAHVL